jgi:hypothetical protein
MKGPTGVDDILKTFEQVREAESSMPSTAAQAAQEIQSVYSEEMNSMAGSERTSGGRRRRARAAPTGNVISLGV